MSQQQQQGEGQSGQQSGQQQDSDTKKSGKEAVKKMKIPHVSEAGGDPKKILAAAQHALDQVKGGHYALENFREVDQGNGRVSITFDRVELDLNVEAHPHKL